MTLVLDIGYITTKLIWFALRELEMDREACVLCIHEGKVARYDLVIN